LSREDCRALGRGGLAGGRRPDLGASAASELTGEDEAVKPASIRRRTVRGSAASPTAGIKRSGRSRLSSRKKRRLLGRDVLAVRDDEVAHVRRAREQL
jgi:hypothetical protein